MNRSDRLLSNEIPQRHVPAPGMGRATPMLAPMALLLGALLASAAAAQARLPQGGEVIAGHADISHSGNGAKMTIHQTTPKAILHWQSFDIGNRNSVQFHQPDANAVALNRVIGDGVSHINGRLGANGQVWLVNPNGVVFGQHSQVNVGGLVASTLAITNEDFAAGRQVFTRGAAQGAITSGGKITVADGATLALLAPSVKNEGTLSARLGNVVLAGGDKVTLQAGVDGRLQVAVSPATVRTLMENSKLILADGGQVVMTASAADALSASMVSNAGTVQARTLENRKGRIMLLGDMQHGQAEHSGMLDASAPASGDGGFVNACAAKVRIKPGARITTAASRGNTGLWESASTSHLLIHKGDAFDNIQDIASTIDGEALEASLADTNVALHARAPHAAKRHIYYMADIRHDRNRLALNADHNIDIAVAAVEGTGTLHLNYGGTAGSPDAPAAAGSQLKIRGQVGFAKSGSGLLRINGHDFEVIQDLATLQSVGHEDRLGGKYAMGRSLDARNVDFEPIGNDAKAFTGTFDGLGHVIRDLTIQRAHRNAVGMFGRTTNATLRNVKLLRAHVKGKNIVGGLVGLHQAAGGTASIFNVQAVGRVQGENAVGGLVGSNLARDGTARIAKVEAHGTVEAVAEGAFATGGLAGINEAHGGTASIVDAHADARANGKDCVGGLVGVNRAIAGTASITDAFAGGDVSGHSRIGALIGKNEAASRQGTVAIADALAMGKVTSTRLAGELIGDNPAAEGISSISRTRYWPMPQLLRPGQGAEYLRSGFARACRELNR